MLVSVLELPASWGASAAVLARVEALLDAGPRPDLALLPEAALHGYVSPERDFDLAPFAEPIDGPTARRCAGIAAARSLHLVAPLVLREGGALYNAMACFDPRGEVAFVYRKRHPWVPETWATAGDQPMPVVAIHGRAVTIAICYDLHFLADDAADQLAAADLLLFPSAWVERPDSRPVRLAALAREFDLEIANANWAPGVVRVPGQGGSAFFGPDGIQPAQVPIAGRLDRVIE
jgi:5-aminopentanamidase